MLPVLQSESREHWNDDGGGIIGTHEPLSQAKSVEQAGTHYNDDVKGTHAPYRQISVAAQDELSVHEISKVGSAMHILPLQMLPALQSESRVHWNELGGGTIGTHFPLSHTKLLEQAGVQVLTGVEATHAPY